ncbi:MAG: hypothetical protein JWN88_998 [Frankiales bacterium]|jgi:hypothetical protein|nr:hypothetical protein [Frankiales bacterium]
MLRRAYAMSWSGDSFIVIGCPLRAFCSNEAGTS